LKTYSYKRYAIVHKWISKIVCKHYQHTRNERKYVMNTKPFFSLAIRRTSAIDVFNYNTLNNRQFEVNILNKPVNLLPFLWKRKLEYINFKAGVTLFFFLSSFTYWTKSSRNILFCIQMSKGTSSVKHKSLRKTYFPQNWQLTSFQYNYISVEWLVCRTVTNPINHFTWGSLRVLWKLIFPTDWSHLPTTHILRQVNVKFDSPTVQTSFRPPQLTRRW
jgi:hypothetical protein